VKAKATKGISDDEWHDAVIGLIEHIVDIEDENI
jgi:hypothetical protein